VSLSTFNFKLFLFVFFITICSCVGTTLFIVETHLKENIKENINKKSYKYLFLNGTADWIALGDSHTARSLSNTFWLDNLGYASDNLESLTEKASHRINRLKPVGVILPADPQIFSFYRLSDNQQSKTKYLISEEVYFFNFLNPIHRPYLIVLAKSIYKNRFSRMFNIQNIDEKKLDWIDIPIEQRRYETSIRVQLHTPILEFEKHPSHGKYIEMIKSYSQLGISICLVRYPVSKLYLNKTQAISQFSNVNKFFERLSKENNFKFLDLSDALTNNQFTDTDHIKSEYKNIITNLVKKGCEI
jgi:hypothetical protein